MNITQLEAAQKWSILLRQQARDRHSTELGSSSLNDLADNLDALLRANKELGDKCNDYDTLKQRVAELEGAAKAQRELSKAVTAQPAKPRPQPVKEASDAVA